MKINNGVRSCFLLLLVIGVRSCFVRLHEIFKRGKKQDLTPIMAIMLLYEIIERGKKQDLTLALEKGKKQDLTP